MLIPLDAVSTTQVLSPATIGQGRFQPALTVGSTDAQFQKVFAPQDTVELSDDAQFAAGTLGAGDAQIKAQPSTAKDNVAFPSVLARLLQAYGLGSPVQEPGLAVQNSSGSENVVALKQDTQAAQLTLTRSTEGGGAPDGLSRLPRDLSLSIVQGIYPYPRQNEVHGQFNLGRALDFVA